MDKPKRESIIPSYQEVIEEVNSAFVSNNALSALYVNCSKLNNIEKHFGKKVYMDILKKIHVVLNNLKGKQIRIDDIIVSTEVASDEYIIFLSKKRVDLEFSPTGLENLCERITEYLNDSISPITFQYLRGRPKIVVGYAVIIHNPLIRDERLMNKLIEDAKLMSTYQDFKRLMRNKEKLQELILKESIRTFFHPIVDLTNNSVIGYEALTRGPAETEYEHPYILFDVAEDTDLLFELDQLCRKKALENAKGILPGLKLFVNCLPSAVLDPKFRDTYLRDCLRDLDLNPSTIVLEVTERQAIEQYDLFMEAAQYYADMGFAIAVDDTGAGYSSLETVVELKPQYIKLDISIVREIDKNILKQELIKAIVGLSKQMRSTVIAEGVETVGELNTLKEIGIKFGQGFLFAKPGPPFPDINL
ncbi:MAG: EAL domain-containing protein [Nitrospiraceae bacterium]|jgi:EAL domain-containing protein (putative c-di-GMP-specific phosphodiesterase class I)|nr:MAG: EAL domain-containing protein [Nitrospiraceae bacterium]